MDGPSDLAICNGLQYPIPLCFMHSNDACQLCYMHSNDLMGPGIFNELNCKWLISIIVLAYNNALLRVARVYKSLQATLSFLLLCHKI